MGEQAEEHSGRNRADASDDPTTAVGGAASPSGNGAAGAPVSAAPTRVGDHRTGVAVAVRVGLAARAILNLLAAVVRLVACLFAVVLLVRIGLAFVAVNPQNAIVEWIVRFSDVIVWGFRDMFLPADPRIALLANYGLAAVFWMAVGMAVAGALSGLGRLVAGRSPS